MISFDCRFRYKHQNRVERDEDEERKQVSLEKQLEKLRKAGSTASESLEHVGSLGRSTMALEKEVRSI